jgi:hypothetical protein
MFPNSIFPTSFFPPSYFEKNGITPPSHKHGHSWGAGKKQIIAQLAMMEFQRQNAKETIEALLKQQTLRRVKQMMFEKELRKAYDRRNRVISSLAMIFAEI